MSKRPAELAHAQPAAFCGTLEVVTFFAGGRRCAVEARQVRGSRAFSTPRDESFPAIDALLGLPEQVRDCAVRQVLTLRQPESGTYTELTVLAPVELRELRCDAIHPLPDLLAARNRLHGLRALALEADGLTLIFDLRDLTAKAPREAGQDQV